MASGGCSPVNWLSQTKRNLAIEYLNLNFVPHFMRKKFLFRPFGSFLFRECVPHLILFDTDFLKFSTRSVTVNIFN